MSGMTEIQIFLRQLKLAAGSKIVGSRNNSFFSLNDDRERFLARFQFSNFASFARAKMTIEDPSVFHRSFFPPTVKIGVTKESILDHENHRSRELRGLILTTHLSCSYTRVYVVAPFSCSWIKMSLFWGDDRSVETSIYMVLGVSREKISRTQKRMIRVITFYWILSFSSN